MTTNSPPERSDDISEEQQAWSRQRFICDGMHDGSIRGMWFVHVPGHREEVLTAMFNTPYLGPWVLVYSNKQKALEIWSDQFPAFMLVPIEDPDRFMQVLGRGLNRFALDMLPGDGGDVHFREIEATPLALTFTQKIYEADMAAMKRAEEANPDGPLPFGPTVAAQLTKMTARKSTSRRDPKPRTSKKKKH